MAIHDFLKKCVMHVIIVCALSCTDPVPIVPTVEPKIISFVCCCMEQVPFEPKLSHEGDTQNFDGYAEIDYKMIMPAPEKDRVLFVDF